MTGAGGGGGIVTDMLGMPVKGTGSWGSIESWIERGWERESISPTWATTEDGADKPAELAGGIASAPRKAGGPGRIIGLNGEFPVLVPSLLLSKGFRTCSSEFQRVSVILRTPNQTFFTLLVWPAIAGSVDMGCLVPAGGVGLFSPLP